MSRSTSSKKSQTPKSRTDSTPKKGTTTHGYTMLMIRVEEGNLNDVKAALKQYPEEGINDQNKHGQTALSLAARNGNSTICEFLLAEGADVNLPNKSGQSPLFIACSYNQFEIANLLLYHGANVNSADSRGWTPLMSACQNSNVRLVELLLTYKADITPIDRFGKRARERTKDRKITKILDEMERRLEMLEEAAKYNTPRRKTSRSRSKGSASRREGEEEPQNEEEYDSKHLDSTLRACPQFVSDMEIYKMHKRAGYYKYHKAGDPRNLYPSSAATLRRKTDGSFETTTYDRNFNSALKSPFNNDLLSCITRGRPLTGRTATPKLNDSKLSNPLKEENNRRAKSGSAKRASESSKLGTKSIGSPIVNQISQSFIDNMKKFSQSKEANPFKRQNGDSIVKTVVKPRRSLLEVFEDEVTDDEEEDCEDVMNDELKTLYSLFVKKLAKRTEKTLGKKVTFMVDKESRENNGPITQERREQIISQKGAEIEGKTISDFNNLLTDLLNCYKLGDPLAQTVREGTETIINRVTALAQHNLLNSPRREIDFNSAELLELQKVPLPINPEAIPAFLEERMTEKVKGELYTKLDEIFEVLDEAIINKSDDQKSQLTRNFRSQALKALNKLRMDLLQDLLMNAPPSMEQLQDYRSQDAESTTSIEKGLPLRKSNSSADVDKVKGEINNKLEEIFKILDEACFNKPEGEKAQFLKNFRAEFMKALNKIRASFVDDLLRESFSSSSATSPLKKGEVPECEAKIFIIEAPVDSEGAYTGKLREEVNKKMGEIYEILDGAIEGKTEEEREGYLRDFRCESLKSLNKLRLYLLHDLLLKTPAINLEKISHDDSREFLEDLQRKKSQSSSQLRKHLEMTEKPQNNSSEASGNFRYASTALNSIEADEMPQSLLVQPTNPFLSDTVKGGHKSSPTAATSGKNSTNTLVLVDEEQIRKTPRSYRYEEEQEELEESPNMIERAEEESLSDNEGLLNAKFHKSPEGNGVTIVEESLNDLDIGNDETACRTGDNVNPTINTELYVPSSSEVFRKESDDACVRPTKAFAETCHAGELESDEEPSELTRKPVVEEADCSLEGVGPVSAINEACIGTEEISHHNHMEVNQHNAGDLESDNEMTVEKKVNKGDEIVGDCIEMIMAAVEGCIAEKLFTKKYEKTSIVEEENDSVMQKPSGNAVELESDEDRLDEQEISSHSIEKIIINNAGDLENDEDDESPEAAMRLIADIKSELAHKKEAGFAEKVEENTYEYLGSKNVGMNNAGDLESDNDEADITGASSKDKIQMSVYDYLEGIITKIEAQQAAESSINVNDRPLNDNHHAGDLESDHSESPVLLNKDASASVIDKPTLIAATHLAGDLESDNEEHIINVNKDLHHLAGELESDGDQSATHVDAKAGAILIQDNMNKDDNIDSEEEDIEEKSQVLKSREEDDEVNLEESQRTDTKSSNNNNNTNASQVSGSVYEREMIIEESDFMARRRQEIDEAQIGKIIDDIQTVASEVLYNRPSDLSDVTSFRRCNTGNTVNTMYTGKEGILERTETRESEVIYKYDEDHSAQLQDEMTIQNKYKMLDVMEDPMERYFNPASGYESMVRFEGLDGEKCAENNSSYNNKEGEIREEEEGENENCGSGGIDVQVQDIDGSCMMVNPEEKRKEMIQAAVESRRASIKESVKELIKRAIEERARDKIFEKQREVAEEGQVNGVRLSVGSVHIDEDEEDEEIKEEGKAHFVPVSLTGITEDIAQENKARKVKTVTFKTMNSREENSLEEFDADKEQDNVRVINKVGAESMGRLKLTRKTITETVKAFNSRFAGIIPIPAPSRTVNEIKVMRIDEIPYCENFHYLGQSKNGRSLSMAFPKKVLREIIVGREEAVFEKAKEL